MIVSLNAIYGRDDVAPACPEDDAPVSRPKPVTDYIGQPARAINADLIHLETARSQLEACIGAIEKLKERAILRPTEGRLDDLINGLTDCKSDLSHAIVCAEDAAMMRAAE